jgi:hypothetical protein
MRAGNLDQLLRWPKQAAQPPNHLPNGWFSRSQFYWHFCPKCGGRALVKWLQDLHLLGWFGGYLAIIRRVSAASRSTVWKLGK